MNMADVNVKTLEPFNQAILRLPIIYGRWNNKINIDNVHLNGSPKSLLHERSNMHIA